jgi:chromate transporter
MTASAAPRPEHSASLWTVAREWTRIGLTGFGGPPAHIALLRQLMVDRMQWMDAHEFQDANAACGLLPGPASTQLAIFSAYRVAGPAGAVVGGLGFIAPAVILILALSLLFLAHSPPLWVSGAGAGAGAVVAAVAVQAARGLIAPSLQRVRDERGGRSGGVSTSRSGPRPRRCSAPIWCSRCWPADCWSSRSASGSRGRFRCGFWRRPRCRSAGSARWCERR